MKPVLTTFACLPGRNAAGLTEIRCAHDETLLPCSMTQKVELGAGLPGEGHEGGTQDDGQPLVPAREALHSHVWQPVPIVPVGLYNTQCNHLTVSHCSSQHTLMLLH